MAEYEFTKDWFSQHINLWQQLVPLLPARKAFLEIGCYEGRATVWMIENMIEDGGYVTCIDPWQPTDVHPGDEETKAYTRFKHNSTVAKAAFPKRGLVTYIDSSYEALCCLGKHEFQYDFIYVDGDHTCKGAMTDACMAWPLLKPGGVMVFDDYTWGDVRDLLHRPKLAIDMFATLFAEELNILHMGHQYVVQKLAPAPVDAEAEFNYGNK